MNSKELGQWGETLAAEWLAAKGYHIVVRNYKPGRCEIDLIARLGALLVFVEVKCRHSTAFGYPEAAVSKQKQAHIKQAAEHYIFEQNWQGDIRFDIIAIVPGPPADLCHLEDAFY